VIRPINAPSPSFDDRRAAPDMIILHYTGMADGPSALARLTDPAARVSAHYLIEEDGRIFALVAEDRRAWHAGRGVWRGDADINARSIGVEIVNPGHDWGYRPFPDVQIAAVIDLVSDIRARWRVPDALILGHSDIAPDRKTDPGELFPWPALAAAGHGLWAAPDPVAAPGAPLALGDEGAEVAALRSDLARLGYGAAPAGAFDAPLAAIVRAFQRHWRPGLVDGRADGETRARLAAILALAAAGHPPA
jgi:N-acetylmuramoyl-L-alanine amidase